MTRQEEHKRSGPSHETDVAVHSADTGETAHALELNMARIEQHACGDIELF